MLIANALETSRIALRIMEGQSNSVGLVDAYLLPPELNVTGQRYIFLNQKWQKLKLNINNAGDTGAEYYTGHYGIEMRLMYLLEQYYQKPQYLLKMNFGGVSLSPEGGVFNWSPQSSNNLFDRSKAFYLQMKATHLGKKMYIKAYHWIQGEQDCNTLSMANAYKPNLVEFIAAKRAFYKSPDMPFIIYTLSSFQTGLDGERFAIVRQTQLDVAEIIYNAATGVFTRQFGQDVVPGVITILHNEQTFDGMHYSAEGYDNLAYYGFEVEKTLK